MAAQAPRSSADSVTTEFRTRHPAGLWVLFTTEMWERFNFYGMRALLVLFMVYALGFTDESATSIYAAYGTLVYALPILGGYLADKLLGYRRAILLGGVLMALGEFALTIPSPIIIYLALALICVGNGFFKPNISSTVGKLYAPGDPMRDRGFTIFYMGINIGAFVAPLVCSWVARQFADYESAWIAARESLARAGVAVEAEPGTEPRRYKTLEEFDQAVRVDLDGDDRSVEAALDWYPQGSVAVQAFERYRAAGGGEKGWMAASKYLAEEQGVALPDGLDPTAAAPRSAQEMAELLALDYRDPELRARWRGWYATYLPTLAYHAYRAEDGGEAGWRAATARLADLEMPPPEDFYPAARPIASAEEMAAVLGYDLEGDPALAERALNGFVLRDYEDHLTAEAYQAYEARTAGARRIGFAMAGVGMLIAIVAFLRGQRRLEGAGQPPDPERLFRPRFGMLNLHHLTWLGCLAIAPVVALLLDHHEVTRYLLYALAVAVAAYIVQIARAADAVQRGRIAVFGILWIFHTAFWALFEQAGSSLTLFAERNVDRRVFGMELLTEWFQSVNPAFIVLLAPLFTGLWAVLERRRLNPTIPMKFGLGVVLLACGYVVLVLGGRAFHLNGLTPVLFLVLLYLLHTMGELCLSPVGLSAVTKLAPPAAVGFFMGAWFLSISFAHSIAGLIAKETAIQPGMTRAEGLEVYLDVYWKSGLILLGMGLLLMAVSRLVNKLAHGVR